jgi:hypothetical protein
VTKFDRKTHAKIPTITESHSANAAIAQPHRQLIKGPDAEKWQGLTARELGRLAQGYDDTEGTNTIFFQSREALPPGRLPTYISIVCAHHPAKPDPDRVRITVGGDRIQYSGNLSTPTVDITTVKILINSILSTPNAKGMSLDLKNFYLNTPLDRYEYINIPVASIPPDFMDKYNLHQLVHNGNVIAEVRKGMYGLPQAGILAYELLVQRLAKGGYHPSKQTPGLFLHDSNGIAFTLWVDDFFVKYTTEESAKHLMETLQQDYELTADWTGARYLGMTLDWDYRARTCAVSMPGYVQRALDRFAHPTPDRPQHAPSPWTPPQYGVKVQVAPDDDASPLLDKKQITRLQEIIGVFLFYARMVDNTMLVALGDLASAQSKGTTATMIAANHLLNYAATHPEATILYRASDMILHIISDASYLSAPKARSRLAGYFFLSVNTATPPGEIEPPPPFNAPILINATIIKSVVSSAAEAELGALFYNAKDGCIIRTTLEDLGHKQPATLIETDNSCAHGIANQNIKRKRSKAMDMNYYWIVDRIEQDQFRTIWRPGKGESKATPNAADYHSKHHSPAHHRLMRPRYLHVTEQHA